MPKATEQGVPGLGLPALSSRCDVSTRWDSRHTWKSMLPSETVSRCP